MKHYCLLLLIVLFGCDSIQNKDHYSNLKGHYDQLNLPPVLLGVIKKNGEREVLSFDSEQRNVKKATDENEIFRIFSMTKPIITVAALQLVEQGKIELESPINHLLPEMASIPILGPSDSLYVSNRSITLKHLLTHTSGFGYNFIYNDLKDFDKSSWSHSDLPRLFEPGQGWAYGTSIDWLGVLIERITNENLEEYISNTILRPLEMNKTFFTLPPGMEDSLVSWGIRGADSKIKDLPLINNNRKPNNKTKSLYSSLNDYMNFLLCILNDGKFKDQELLRPETVAMMFKNNLPTGIRLDYGNSVNQNDVDNFLDKEDHWGFGWAIEANEQESIRPIGAVYWSGSANTYFTIDKKQGIGLVYFSQVLPFNDSNSLRFYKMFENEFLIE